MAYRSILGLCSRRVRQYLGGLLGVFWALAYAAAGGDATPSATATVAAVLDAGNSLAVTATVEVPGRATGRYVIHRLGEESIRDVAVRSVAGIALDPGTVTVQRRSRFWVLGWPAQETDSTYEVSYALAGVAFRRPDAVVLMCDLVSAGQAYAFSRVDVRLAVPGGSAAIRGVPVVRTGARSVATQVSLDGVRVAAADLPAQSYLRIELYLDGNAVVCPFSPRRFMDQTGGLLLLWLLPALALSALLALYWGRGRDPRIRPEGEAVTLPSPGMTPEIAGTLIDEYTEPRDLLAAVVDLARCGALRLVHVPGHGSESAGVRVELAGALDGLSPSRRAIAEAVSSASAAGSAAPVTPEAGLSRAGVRALAEAVQREAAESGFFRRSPGAERRLYRGAGLLLLGVGAGLSLLPGDVVWVARAGYGLFLAGLPFLLLAPLMPQRTLRGAREKARLFSYQAHLGALDAASVDPEQRQAVFEEGLGYAIAFRLRKEWINRFSAVGAPTPRWWQVAGQEWATPPSLETTREPFIQTLSVLSSALGESPLQGGGG